ncbi:MAG: GyrI-like domain-containing protein [Tannerella sp.]|jgi:DNA gyrase inhibitor GyrI/AraC-like DNA-binding protein|nr:GyrI-like domain-containing protein [Tannerella sp.]
MKQNADKQYCQSCGMPLRFDVEEYMGTNADHSCSDEYCFYCLKDGEFTVDIPMSEMVDIWVKYTDKYNWYSDTNYTPQELRTLLNKRMPTLKRYRQKEETQNIHDEVINRIRTYIDRNLFLKLEPEQLAAEANFSYYHFRRIFQSITGENIWTYIQRLRLEYIAHLLIATEQSIESIRQQTNYQTKFSLAKAFKKHFGLSMTEYRIRYRFLKEQEFTKLPKVEIRRINTCQAVCREVGNTYLDQQFYASIWKELIHYGMRHLKQAAGNKFICISQDNPFITNVDQRRFHIGIVTDEEIKHKGRFFMQEIPGGMYAVFRCKGSYSGLPELYKTIYEQWLPHSEYYLKHPQTFDIFINTPNEVAVDELLTEIYIPIEKKKSK